MSALPNEIMNSKVNSIFLKNIIENCDKCLLSNKESYELKGGDSFMLKKLLCGLISFSIFIKFSQNKNNEKIYLLNCNIIFFNFR